MTKGSYNGSDQLHVGDGVGLSINNVGKSVIQSNLSSKPLFLNQLLHVPKLTKNLISVYQLVIIVSLVNSIMMFVLFEIRTPIRF